MGVERTRKPAREEVAPTALISPGDKFVCVDPEVRSEGEYILRGFTTTYFGELAIEYGASESGHVYLQPLHEMEGLMDTHGQPAAIALITKQGGQRRWALVDIYSDNKGGRTIKAIRFDDCGGAYGEETGELHIRAVGEADVIKFNVPDRRV